MKLDAIFFAAHPDDAELSCGGTIRKLVKSGKKIGIVDLTLGELSTRGKNETRKIEAEKSNKVLGISVRENLKIPDGNIEKQFKKQIKSYCGYKKIQARNYLLPSFSRQAP